MVNKRVSEGADTVSEFDFKLLSVGVKRSMGDFRLDLPLTRACSKNWKIRIFVASVLQCGTLTFSPTY